MTSMLRPVLALCLVGFFSFSSAQEISTTGNLINNGSWSGATYGADPGGCCASISGSGALYDTSTDTIMFSYGLDTLVQTVGLQQALGGTGVQVHGYNYSFDYRLMPNSATHTDNLTASIWLTTSSGFNTEATHLFLSGQVSSGVNDQWNSISGTRNFELPYTDPQSVTMRLEGRDGGFWAGYYGPEVRNVSLSVNYSFDPCASDPLYSTSCAGYWDAFLAQIGSFLNWGSGADSADPGSPDSVMAAAADTTAVAVTEDTTRTEPVVDAGGIEVSTTGELTVPDGRPDSVRTESTAAAETEERERREGPNLSQILSIVREATDNTAALATVNNSIAQSVSSAANPADGIGLDGTGAENIAAGLLPHLGLEGGSLDTVGATESGITVAVAPVIDPVQDTQIVVSQSLPRLDAMSAEAVSEDPALGTATDAVSEVTLDMPTATVIADTENTTADQEQRRDTAPPSELSGGVDVAELTQTPQDFTAYLDRSLQDARFYQEREIYPGQQTVDNRRAQRLLSGASDRVHQSMVDQQYRRP
jgi:hypothetical protein